MAPVAWGEHRVFGWPAEGLLVVREVVGKEAAALFRAF